MVRGVKKQKASPSGEAKERSKSSQQGDRLNKELQEDGQIQTPPWTWDRGEGAGESQERRKPTVPRGRDLPRCG